MWILPLVGFSGVILGFCFLTLAIASGLYYLSELVEEYSVFSKKLLQRMIYGIIAIQTLLWLFDSFPLKLSLLAIGSHIVYMQNLRHFPIVKLTDPFFLLSCVLVLINHYLWFQHFQRPPPSTSSWRAPSYSSSPYTPYSQPQLASFNEVASFFGICVWLIPFTLFVALSSGDNILPSMGSEYATGEGSSFVTPGKEKGKSADRSGLAKQVIDGVREWVGDISSVVGGRARGGGTKEF